MTRLDGTIELTGAQLSEDVVCGMVPLAVVFNVVVAGYIEQLQLFPDDTPSRH